MRKIELQDLTSTLEPGYAPAPVQAGEAAASLKLCVLCRPVADPASGHFVLIRRSPRATVYLGCLIDGGGRPVDWIEVWVQNVTSLDHIHPSLRKTLTNATLDQRWDALVSELRELDPEQFFSSPYERAARPAWIDPAGALSMHPADAASGEPWNLCRQDELLLKAGLPAYSGSVARYLATAAGDHFIPATPDAPRNEKTIELAQASPEASRFAPLNPAGERMLFRRFSPFSLEEFTEVLGGKAWRGLENARKAFHPGGVYALFEDEDLLRCGATHLFSASAGRAGRFVETLHLKLQLIQQLFRLTRETIRKSKLPMLNLTAESFRVSLGATGLGLPLLWTEKAALVSPGVAFALPITNSAERYFEPAEPLAASIYRPSELAVPKSGHGSVRLRKVSPSGEGLIVEGTLTTQERIGVDESELIWVQLPVPDGKVDLYGFRDTTQAMALGEAVFRTIPQQHSAAASASLQSVVGVPFSQVPFSILPPLSSPCDLYSLGVIATRLLLVNPRNPLPQALDTILSLARQVASQYKPEETAGDRAAAIAGGDPRWLETLGPQLMRSEETSPADAAAALPLKLWWDLLGFVIRLFPGTGPDSFCKGFGDAPPLALQAIFDQPIEELSCLCLRSRALVTLEWEHNVEIATLIKAAEQQY